MKDHVTLKHLRIINVSMYYVKLGSPKITTNNTEAALFMLRRCVFSGGSELLNMLSVRCY